MAVPAVLVGVLFWGADMRKYSRGFFFLALALAFSPLTAQGKGGLGDLMVMPTRVILEGRDRSAEIMLRNSGTEICTYRIFFQEMRMTPNGKVEVVPKEEGVLTATDLVMFTPKQVELLPGEIQTVRIHLRKPEGLKDGEYRSHMVFQGLPAVEPPKPMQAETDNTVSFDIKTIVSISIPIIVRHGETSVSVNLSDMVFNNAPKPDESPSMDLTMARRGNRSVQGEFKVDWLPTSGKPKTILPIMGGVIYSELESRTMHLDFPEAKGLPIKDGKLKVTYTFKDIKQQPVVAFLDIR